MRRTVLAVVSSVVMVMVANGAFASGDIQHKKQASRHAKVEGKARHNDHADHSAEVLAALKAKYPATTFGSVTKAPIGDLYEVVLGQNIAYVDRAADLFLFGHIFDMKAQVDLTQARLDDLTRVDFDTLPLKQAIKIVKGDGKRVFAVFSDPDCPYCRALESTLGNMDNYTMYVFLFPLTELHPNAADHANELWCSGKAASIWHDFMTGKISLPPVKGDCKAPLDEIGRFGAALGLRGTPMIIRKDGRRMPGALPQASLEEFISGGDPMKDARRIPVNEPAAKAATK